MEPLLKIHTLARCLPGSQAHLKTALQPFAALRSPSLVSCCLLSLHNAGYQDKGKAGPCWFWWIETWLIQFANLGQYFVVSLPVALHWNYLGSKQIVLLNCAFKLNHQVSNLGHLEVRVFWWLFGGVLFCLFFFLFGFLRALPSTRGKVAGKLSLYKTTKNTYVHYFYLAWKLVCQLNCIDF